MATAAQSVASFRRWGADCGKLPDATLSQHQNSYEFRRRSPPRPSCRKMFRLNTTGASIIELLTKGYTEDRIATEISERCGVDGALVCSDVHAFLASLKEHGLVMDGDPR